MKIAVTGAAGFVGSNLAAELIRHGHEVVRITRRKPSDPSPRPSPHRGEGTDAPVGLDDVAALAAAFAGCGAVAHVAGINREIGRRTYRRVHVQGTRNVVEAAHRAGVGKIALLSFLRARPACGSPYHESKWAAEEIVRRSGIDFTILKAGVIYGRGDHMLDHLSRAFHTFPIFGLVGMREQLIRPAAVADVVRIIAAALTQGRLPRATVAVTGPEEMTLSQAVRRVAAVIGARPLFVRLPLWFHRLFAGLAEMTMRVPLVSTAQVRILSEGLVQPAGAVDPLPADLTPATPFSKESIRAGLPAAGPFTWADCRWVV